MTKDKSRATEYQIPFLSFGAFDLYNVDELLSTSVSDCDSRALIPIVSDCSIRQPPCLIELFSIHSAQGTF